MAPRAGRLSEAEQLCREALTASRETLGDRHPDTLLGVHNLAVLLRDQGACVPGHRTTHTRARVMITVQINSLDKLRSMGPPGCYAIL